MEIKDNNNSMETGALLSDCRTYRYVLWRVWDEQAPICNFIMLNPSTANEDDDDPTIRRVINYAKDWGYGSVYVTNLFAYRATDQKELKHHPKEESIGLENDASIMECASFSKLILCAWGINGNLYERSNEVIDMMSEYELYYLKLSKNNQPMHPLYQKKELKPLLMESL